MGNGIIFYIDWLSNIMNKYGLEDSFLHSKYRAGILKSDLTPCYIDDRVSVKGKRQFKKEISELLDTYFEEFPQAKKPLYNYH